MITIFALIYGIGVGLIFGVVIGFKLMRKDASEAEAKHNATVKGLLGVLDDSISNVKKLMDQNRILQKFILSGCDESCDCDPEADDDDDDDEDNGHESKERTYRNN
jgi:hypothetical protein